MVAKCYRIIIKGSTTSSIQGINLREKIEKFVKTPIDGVRLDIKGKVRNLKNGNVEITCFGSDVQKLYDKIMEWKGDQDDGSHVDFKECVMYDYPDKEILESTDFVIERSDDQSEMVWALRGAGSQFLASTKALNKINDTIIERDKKRAIGRLLTLHYELIHNRDQLADPKQCKDRIHTDAMASNIGDPAVYDKKFVYPLSEVFFGLEELKQSSESSTEVISQLKEDIQTLLNIIQEELSKLGEVL